MSARISRIGLFVSIIIVLSLSLTTNVLALVNINTASLSELDDLPYVGATTSQLIIDGRPYSSVEEITKVKGFGSGPGSRNYDAVIDLITVGDVSQDTTGQTSTSTDETTQEDNATTTDSTDTATDTTEETQETLSAHYEPASLSTYKKLLGITVGAGRTRLAVAGGPVEFKAETESDYVRNIVFKWSFGDGTTGEGAVVNHTYQYPGDYVVILNADSNQGSATSRTEVKVVKPDIAVTYAGPDRIDVTSSSSNEINLYGRALVSGGKIFAFPRDTIVLRTNHSLVFFHNRIVANQFKPNCTRGSRRNRREQGRIDEEGKRFYESSLCSL